MKTVLERETIESTEKERHNAMINERYRKLLDAVEDQVSTPTENVYASTREVEAPALDTMQPTVTTYAPTALASSVFTAEKFERLEGFGETKAQTPVVVARPQEVTRTSTATAAHYSLTPLAKIAMAVFTLLVVAMLVLIGVNSRIIHRKTVRLQNLEEKKQELMEKNAEIQRRIQELQTEESIIERATQAGLLN